MISVAQICSPEGDEKIACEFGEIACPGGRAITLVFATNLGGLREWRDVTEASAAWRWKEETMRSVFRSVVPPALAVARRELLRMRQRSDAARRARCTLAAKARRIQGDHAIASEHGDGPSGKVPISSFRPTREWSSGVLRVVLQVVRHMAGPVKLFRTRRAVTATLAVRSTGRASRRAYRLQRPLPRLAWQGFERDGLILIDPARFPFAVHYHRIKSRSLKRFPARHNSASRLREVMATVSRRLVGGSIRDRCGPCGSRPARRSRREASACAAGTAGDGRAAW